MFLITPIRNKYTIWMLSNAPTKDFSWPIPDTAMLFEGATAHLPLSQHFSSHRAYSRWNCRIWEKNEAESLMMHRESICIIGFQRINHAISKYFQVLPYFTVNNIIYLPLIGCSVVSLFWYINDSTTWNKAIPSYEKIVPAGLYIW